MKKECSYCSKDFLKFIKEYSTAVVVICTSVISIILANYHPTAKHHVSALLYYGILPLLVSTLLLRIHPLDMGLGIGKPGTWIPLSCLYLFFAVPLVYLGASSQGMRSFYGTKNFDFLTYGLNMSVYMLGWEFLFRGFLLFGLKKKFKEGSILIQMIPFTLLHLGKPEMEAVSCIISGIVWGYICFKGNSFWPAVLMHLTVNFFNKLLITGYFSH